MVEAIEPVGSSGAGDAVWLRLEDQVRWYADKSRRAQKAYKQVKLGQIAVGAIVPVLAATGVAGYVTAIVAAAVVIGEGAQQLFQWQSNWIHFRTAAEALRHERFLYLAEAGPYTGADRRRILAERIEALTAGENRAWAVERVGPNRSNPAAGNRAPVD
ncbi:DUF4231 domain-containing protein [Nocardia sp. NPDC057440]|uniref:DUF4231 domain-containing protein n=1 Tax=Nocardia sp. NPDC057440 TaxID=3346134 RepID=UPI00366E32D5